MNRKEPLCSIAQASIFFHVAYGLAPIAEAQAEAGPAHHGTSRKVAIEQQVAPRGELRSPLARLGRKLLDAYFAGTAQFSAPYFPGRV